MFSSTETMEDMKSKKRVAADENDNNKRKKKAKKKEKSLPYSHFEVPVATFDPSSIDIHFRLHPPNFFSADEVGSGNKFKSLEHLLSKITFVRDWVSYCRYGVDSKTVKFAYESRDSQLEEDSGFAVSLPQFSSAAVPKWDQTSSDKSRPPSSSNDFILNVGGSVWALDWCPKGHQGASNQINYEYLAVGAHPPGYSLHNIGMPVSGKGVVQIWTIANLKEKASPPKRQKVRGKKQVNKTEPVHREDNDSNSIAPVLSREPTVEQCNVPDSVKMPDNNEEDDIPMGIPIDYHYQEATCKDAEFIAQKGKKKMKDKARSKIIDNTVEVTPASIVTKSVSCLDTDGGNYNIRKKVGSTGRKAKSPTAAPLIDETSTIPLEEISLPRMVLCLAHEGEVAWDVKWQPLTERDLRNQHHLGYLAVLLGDGSMQVWEVPVPNAVNFLFTSSNARGGLDPRFIKLEPVFKCSKLQSDGRQSIPLTLEWSTTTPHDLLLAGCHDGTVALWKFTPKASSSQDTRPLICFTADALAIRALAWAPNEGDAESKNIVVTGGHGGSLRFWDLRDPFRALWDLHLSRGIITSLDWLHEPRCIILSMDDGTLRLLSLCKAALDTPATGRPFCGTQFQGLQSYYCSSFTIWSVQVSRLTGLVAYCSVDGSALHFQLTKKAVDKDKMRHRTPHFSCGSFMEEGRIFKVISPSTLTPVRMKKSLNEWSDTPRSIRGFLSESNQVVRTNIQAAAENKYVQSGSSDLVPLSDGDTVTPSKSRSGRKPRKTTSGMHLTNNIREDVGDMALLPSGQCSSSGVEGLSCSGIEKYPSKQVAVHKVRWNSNKASERRLCYGGSAGIVRCQEITSVFSMQ